MKPITWPAQIKVGSISASLEATTIEKLLEEFKKEFTEEEVERYVPLALYDSDQMRITYRDDIRNSSDASVSRRDLDICHEIVHLWEDVIFANQYDFSEAETQSLALGLHQLINDLMHVEGGDESE